MGRLRVHFHTSEEPAKCGSTLTAICGAPVPRAAICFEAEGELSAEDVRTKSGVNCRDCQRTELVGRYITSICSGQDLIDAELPE